MKVLTTVFLALALASSFAEEDEDAARKFISSHKVIDLGHKVIHFHKEIDKDNGVFQKHFFVSKKKPQKHIIVHDSGSASYHATETPSIDIRGESKGDAILFESHPVVVEKPKHTVTTKTDSMSFSSNHNFDVTKTSQVHTSSFRMLDPDGTEEDEEDNVNEKEDDLDLRAFDHLGHETNFRWSKF